jgi:hypothetical protein
MKTVREHQQSKSRFFDASSRSFLLSANPEEFVVLTPPTKVRCFLYQTENINNA